MLKVGILGAGHLGKIHINCWKMLTQAENDVQITGFFDPDKKKSEEVSREYSLKAYSDFKTLMNEVDIIDIVSPTSTHYLLAKESIAAGKHTFIEKPVTRDLGEAEQLMELTEKADVKVQVGHVERFNPAIKALKPFQLRPMFIEGHRLSYYNERGTDVSVVLDLMIHDLDLILHIVDSEVVEVRASGVNILSETADICNARIEFSSGCVVNLTSSRISLKQMRKLRLFQPEAYISIDMLDKSAEIIQIDAEKSKENNKVQLEIPLTSGSKWLTVDQIEAGDSNAIKEELRSFVNAIKKDLPTTVTLKEGYEALKLAFRIDEKMHKNRKKIESHL